MLWLLNNLLFVTALGFTDAHIKSRVGLIVLS